MNTELVLVAGAIMSLLVCSLTAGQTPATFPARTKVSIQGERWLINGRLTYPGTAAEGLLMNVRMVNSVFEDLGGAGKGKLPAGFDPQANTDAFVSRIPDYVAHGIRAFTINLQGGAPGYEGAINSAYETDGTLRPSYMARVKQVIEAADRQGAVIILGCFYQRQNKALAGRSAIEQAVRNTVRWVVDSGYTNVVLEIANEFNHGGYANWQDGGWLAGPPAQIHLMKLAREAAPGLLVSTSGLGGGTVTDDIAKASDFILVHYNNTQAADMPVKIARMRKFGKPVACNEDMKVGQAGAEAARACVANGASWGFMYVAKNQNVPFEFEGSADDPVTYGALKELTTLPKSAAAPATQTATAPGQALFTVVITEPTDGAVMQAGKPAAIRAGVQGQAVSVEFFADGRPIGRAASAPWTITWTPAAGKCDLTAHATNSAGQTVDSPAVDVIVE